MAHGCSIWHATAGKRVTFLCIIATVGAPVSAFDIVTAGSKNCDITVHAILMIIGWVVLLPSKYDFAVDVAAGCT